MPLLRIYWYDGTGNRPRRTQVAMAEQADVKLRLGRIDASGRQKGVDALIASDMVALARNRAMADCILLAGDDELRIAVAEIQQLGVRVHLVGISPARSTQSRLLRQEADATWEWDADTLRDFMHCRPRRRSDDVPGTTRCHAPRRGRRPRPRQRIDSPGAANGAHEIAQQVVRRVLIREFIVQTGRHPPSRAASAVRSDLRGERPRG